MDVDQVIHDVLRGFDYEEVDKSKYRHLRDITPEYLKTTNGEVFKFLCFPLFLI